MRIFKFIVFLIISILFSCNDDDDSSINRWGTVSALKNGIEWESEIYALEKSYSFVAGQGIDIFIKKYNESGFHRETLHLFKVPDKLGKYILSETHILDKDTLIGADYFTSVDDGDVLGDVYDFILSDSIEDFIEITEINGKEIKGLFHASFSKNISTGEGDPLAPDLIYFTDGQFHTKIVD